MNFKLVLWLLIGVLVIYIAWQAWRLMAASRAQTRSPQPPRAAPARPPQPPPAPDEDEDETDDEDPAPVYDRPRMPPPPPPEPATEQAIFQLELQVRQLSRELAQLRAAHQELASELAAVDARLSEELHDGLDALAGRIEQVPVSSGLAPQYDEAMVFARRGMDAAAIAERCEISIGEAELVRSLARRGGEESR